MSNNIETIRLWCLKADSDLKMPLMKLNTKIRLLIPYVFMLSKPLKNI